MFIVLLQNTANVIFSWPAYAAILEKYLKAWEHCVEDFNYFKQVCCQFDPEQIH